jgi:hypothetical protein
LSAEVKSNLNLDAFVHNADATELAGKSADEVEPNFEWRAVAVEGSRYYIVVRNVGAQGGSAKVNVLPHDTAKSPGDLLAPNAGVMNVYYAAHRTMTGHSSIRVQPMGPSPRPTSIAKVSIPRVHSMGELDCEHHGFDRETPRPWARSTVTEFTFRTV